MKVFVLICVALIWFAQSCTIQKRVHRKGWFIQWHHHKSTSSATETDQVTTGFDQEKKADNVSEITKAVPASIPEGQIVAFNETDQEEAVDTPQKIIADTTSQAISEPTKNTQSEVKKWHVAVPVSVVVSGLIALTLVSIISGAISILIPIGLTAFVGIIALVSIKEFTYKRTGLPPRKRIWHMLFFIGIIWVATLLFYFAPWNVFYSAGIMILLSLVIISYFSTKYNKEKEQQPKKESVEPPKPEPNEPEEKASEREESVPRATYYYPPLRIGQVYPGLTMGMVLCISLALLSGGTMFLIWSFISLLGGTATGSILYIALIPLSLLILGIGLGAIRSKRYGLYLNDYYSVKNTDSQSNKPSTQENTSEEKNNDAATAVLILMLIVVALLLFFFVYL